MAKNNESQELMNKIISLCKRRGFIFPGSEIYGGLANSWDFGPLGSELKKNVKNHWWKTFVQEKDDMIGLDGSIIMNPKTWEASGHIRGFSDALIECKKCHQRFREDHVQETKEKSVLTDDMSNLTDEEKEMIKCSKGDEHEFTEAQQFNLMFKTFIGPAEQKADVAYLRPETAQAIFVDFPLILESSRKKIPFGVAQIGKAFRNEITPGHYIFRTREFEQMEIEYFIEEKDWEKCFEMWLSEMKKWMEKVGIDGKKLFFHEISEDERAHYSKRTVDTEFDYPFGRKELFGLAYRTDYDLSNHQKISGKSMEYFDQENNKKYIPHVIEPTFGVERAMLAILLSAYIEEDAPTADGKTEKRVVMKFKKEMAPIKVAVLPLSKKPELENVARKIYDGLKSEYMCEYDVTQSIGKRYRRQDEIGTPYCVTVDFETLKDNAVTVRDRDTMKQERIKISDLKKYLSDKL